MADFSVYILSFAMTSKPLVHTFIILAILKEILQKFCISSQDHSQFPWLIFFVAKNVLPALLLWSWSLGVTRNASYLIIISNYQVQVVHILKQWTDRCSGGPIAKGCLKCGKINVLCIAFVRVIIDSLFLCTRSFCPLRVNVGKIPSLSIIPIWVHFLHSRFISREQSVRCFLLLTCSFTPCCQPPPSLWWLPHAHALPGMLGHLSQGRGH